MMQLAIALVLTVVGALLALFYPTTVLIAVAICVTTSAVLVYVSRLNPSIASLRHAVLGSLMGTFVVLIVAVLMLYGDLPLDQRNWLRGLIIAAATLPALYWLILLATGGFDGGVDR